MQASRRRPSPALIVAIVALVVSLTGTAWAGLTLGKNSVGSRQLRSKSVTTGKIANNAVTGVKVAKESLTGEDIKLSQLGKVPSAATADTAGDASTVGGHGAACPAGTTLIRGICYDLSLNPAVADVFHAADACAAKGGYLPTTMELYSIRNVINLGSGIPPDYTVADDYFAEPSSGSEYSTMAVDGSGTIVIITNKTATRYICAYPLVR
jgi:hypothetical protein